MQGTRCSTAWDDILPHQHVRDDMSLEESISSAGTPEDGIFRRGKQICHAGTPEDGVFRQGQTDIKFMHAEVHINLCS